jgi:dienelactone hydrolase
MLCFSIARGRGTSIPEMRGKGCSKKGTTGQMTEKATLAAAEAVMEYVIGHKFDNIRIFLWGYSFGGATAVHIACSYESKVSFL